MSRTPYSEPSPVYIGPNPEDLKIKYAHELQEFVAGPHNCEILCNIAKAYQHKAHDGWTINIQDMHMWCEKKRQPDEKCETFFSE